MLRLFLCSLVLKWVTLDPSHYTVAVPGTGNCFSSFCVKPPMIIQTKLRKNMDWQTTTEISSLSGVTAVQRNLFLKWKCLPLTALPWPDQTMLLLLGVLLWCFVFSQTLVMSPNKPVLLFPFCSVFFYFSSHLLKSTHVVPPAPQIFPFFSSSTRPLSNLRISSCLRVKVGKTAGVTGCTKHRGSDPI